MTGVGVVSMADYEYRCEYCGKPTWLFESGVLVCRECSERKDTGKKLTSWQDSQAREQGDSLSSAA